jgi:hypothetical protein
VEGSAPPKQKETAHRLRAGDVGALATLDREPAPTERRIFIVCILLCHDVARKVDCSTAEPTFTLSGNRSGRAALRREVSHGEEGETDHRRHKHRPRKRTNGGTSVCHSRRTALRRAYQPVAKRWLCKQRPLLRNGSVNTVPLLGSRFLIMHQLDYNNVRTVFTWPVPML